MNRLTLGLPSKGRLQDDAIAWFGRHGVQISRDGADRGYFARADGLDGLEVAMLSAGDVPQELASGRIHLGITGEDLIRERLPEPGRAVRIVARCGFGRSDLVVAVPAAWLDVETMHDLDEVACDFRATHGRALRVATKYHNLVRAHFRKHGVADYRLVDSQGATEAAPRNLAADAIADIASTGDTLRANHLKPLRDDPILKSQAVLVVSRTADWSEGASEVLEALETRLTGG